jgi:Leucine-rich repeat (LRR) protein
MGHMSDTPKPKCRWFQFRLRTLLVLVTLCAIPCSWLGVKMRQARRQRDAVAAIKKLGGVVVWSKPAGPRWLREILGDDFFKDVFYVGAVGSEVTDVGLNYLDGLSRLQELDLSNTRLPDAGLERLTGLSQLQVLCIGGTKITDAGLEHLTGLSQLQVLFVGGTKITDAGLEHLKGLGRLRELGLGGTQVTDAGLEHLRALSQLQRLYLFGCEVTDAGVKRLLQAVPKCEIRRSPAPAKVVKRCAGFLQFTLAGAAD